MMERGKCEGSATWVCMIATGTGSLGHFIDDVTIDGSNRMNSEMNINICSDSIKCLKTQWLALHFSAGQ